MLSWVDFREDRKKKKKKEWKIGEKMSGKGVWLRGGGRKKSGGTHKFSFILLQSTISPNWSEK